ncbi:MAG: VOC family protein [Nocardioidaceae bacterium]
MSPAPVMVGLSIADRRTSYEFYCAGLGFTAVGEPADDGVPEPLQLALNDGLRVMLIPTGGFGWVLGNRAVAPNGQHECILTVNVATPTEVDGLVERARGAGAEMVTEPTDQPWGYSATFADPDGHVWQVAEASQ